MATKAQAEKITNKVKAKYNTTTFHQYVDGITKKTIMTLDNVTIDNAIQYFSRHVKELNYLLYESNEIYTYSYNEQNAFSDVLMLYKKWLNIYQEEKRRRKLASLDFNSKLMSTQTQYEYTYDYGSNRQIGTGQQIFHGVSI